MHSSITLERLEKAYLDEAYGLGNSGFCKACGEESEGCEPDARNYRCESCGEYQVFGAAELIIEFV